MVSKTKYKTIYGEGQPFDLATRIKILTPEQMFQRLPISLAQVKADDKSENLLSEIRQILYSLYQVKEIIKKVCNNIMNLIKV